MLKALRSRSRLFLFAFALPVVLLGGYGAYAHFHDDETQIVDTLKRLFERPGTPLQVVSLNQEGDFALAGWLQGNEGGHAFLHKQKDQWALLICGGANLGEAEVLQELGMSKINAERLAAAVEHSEKALNESKRQRINASVLGVTHQN